MDDNERLMLADSKLKLMIVEKKIKVCEESSHNSRHLTRDLLDVERSVLIQWIAKLESI